MANRSLGVIAVVPGTPVKATSNLSAAEQEMCWAHSYMVEAWGATGGDGYVGSATMVKATGVEVYGRIPRSTASQYFYFQATCAIAHDLFNMDTIYIDGDVSGNYLISLIEA